VTAVAGTFAPHNTSAIASRPTTAPGCTASKPSSARCLLPPRRTGAPGRQASNGPSTCSLTGWAPVTSGAAAEAAAGGVPGPAAGASSGSVVCSAAASRRSESGLGRWLTPCSRSRTTPMLTPAASASPRCVRRAACRSSRSFSPDGQTTGSLASITLTTQAGNLRLIDGLLALHGGRWGVAERNAGKTVFAVLPLHGQ
jgi:hypothetical protein